VNQGRNVEDADLLKSGMHCDQIFVIDPEISAKRAQSGVNYDLSRRLASPGL